MTPPGRRPPSRVETKLDSTRRSDTVSASPAIDASGAATGRPSAEDRTAERLPNAEAGFAGSNAARRRLAGRMTVKRVPISTWVVSTALAASVHIADRPFGHVGAVRAAQTAVAVR